MARGAVALVAAFLSVWTLSCAASRLPDSGTESASSTGSAPAAPAAPSPVATAALPKTPQPVGAAICALGKGSDNAVCKKGSAQFAAAVDGAIDYVIEHAPTIFDLTQETAPGTREYKVLNADAYLAGVLDRLRSASFCADLDYTTLKLIEIKSSNDYSEQYEVLLNGFVQRAPGGSYKKTCLPASFPVDPDPNGPPPGSGCGKPYPPPISAFGAKIHVQNSEYWQLDSTPQLTGRDACLAVGFTDGRGKCSVRVEGAPDRVACENWLTGKAKDTGRGGPTWDRDGKPCTGPESGCENDPDNQYELRVYWNGGGMYHPCSASGVCGEVYVLR